MKLCTIIVTLVFAFATTSTRAYELGTHARITEAAYNRSVLKGSKFLKQFGVNSVDPEPFGLRYYDISGADIRERERYAFERRFMPNNAQPLSVEGWLLRGAIREDDLGFAFGRPYGADPHDDPDRPFWRVMHHFFDPIPPRPLTISAGCRALFEWATGETADFRRSPDWAIGALDVFADQNAPEPGRRNHYTIFDARETMYRALGDVVHLIQDMNPPQHIRNDVVRGSLPGRYA